MSAGKPGPIGKRSDERHGHRTAEEQAVDTSAAGVAVVQWPDPDPGWHEVAREWFASLGQSGQRVFYQPSDVARAKYVAHGMSVNLRQGKRFSAQLFAAINSAAGELLDSEGARRRMRVELERTKPEVDEEQQTAVASLADARERLGRTS